MKLFVCRIFGHSMNIRSCPVTHAKLQYCARCGFEKKSSHSGMSFG